MPGHRLFLKQRLMIFIETPSPATHTQQRYTRDIFTGHITGLTCTRAVKLLIQLVSLEGNLRLLLVCVMCPPLPP